MGNLTDGPNLAYIYTKTVLANFSGGNLDL